MNIKVPDNVKSTAIFSPCKKYRYVLQRSWNSDKPPCTFICLNPSTATEFVSDPTVHRCFLFAQRRGYGLLNILNIFGYRSTDPTQLTAVDDPIGPENDKWIVACVKQTVSRDGTVIAAWGSYGLLFDRGKKVLDLLNGLCKIHCVAITKYGLPKHPLYMRNDCKLKRFKV